MNFFLNIYSSASATTVQVLKRSTQSMSLDPKTGKLKFKNSKIPVQLQTDDVVSNETVTTHSNVERMVIDQNEAKPSDVIQSRR